MCKRELRSETLEQHVAPAPSLMGRLREATGDLHRAIEGTVGLAPSREAHRALLAGFLGFIQPWEQQLVNLRSEPVDRLYRERVKTPRLCADLYSCGMTWDEIAALPRCTDLPALAGVASALGSLYVLEGATLGGQIISRHCERVLGMSDGHGYTFFQSYGSDVGAMWRGVGRTVEEHSSLATDGPIILAACETFSKLHAWLCLRK